jgi:uncharacterized membrane protein
VITGTITDQTGAAVPGVKVRAINLYTQAVFVAETLRTGNFVVNVTPGRYNIVVEQPGFEKVTKSSLQVQENASLRVNIELAPPYSPRLIPLSMVKPTHIGLSDGMINGTITDQTGAVVPGVNVQAINLDTQAVFAAETSPIGYFVVSVPPGKYSIVVEQPGFEKVTKSALQVQGNTPRHVDITIMELPLPPRLIPLIMVSPMLKAE